MRTSHVKKCEKHSAKCDCIKEDDLHPPIVQAMRRLRGPTTDDCLDGLTYEETQQIDITKFEVAVRWKPYLAKKPDGTTICLYRLRPMHHDQRSGGVTLDPPYPSPAVETEGEINRYRYNVIGDSAVMFQATTRNLPPEIQLTLDTKLTMRSPTMAWTNC